MSKGSSNVKSRKGNASSTATLFHFQAHHPNTFNFFLPFFPSSPVAFF
jgi:hypothetical protein